MSTDPMEQAFLDGTHPALSRNATGMEQLRSASPTRSRSRSPSVSSQTSQTSDTAASDGGPRFSAIDDDPPTGGDMPSRPAGGGKGRRENGQASSSRNTGVKGVQADYREHMASQQLGQGQVGGLTRNGPGRKMVISLGEEDEEELRKVREKRLRELQGSTERSGRAQARAFGHLREVGMEGFVQAVEEEDESTPVVVHLYEPEIPPCHYLNQHLSHLARLYPSTKFLRALASDLEFMSDSLGTDVDTLPTVLVYRAGELETVWVRFDLELNGAGGREGMGEVEEGERGRKAVEEVLASKNAISGPGLQLSSALLGNGAGTTNGNIRQSGRRANEEEDD